jgi:L-asparaginase
MDGLRLHLLQGIPRTMKPLKRIAMLSTGGTIASVEGEEGRAIAGALPGEALLAQTGLNGVIEATVLSVFQKASNSIGAPEWKRLAEECERLGDSGEIDGIVITHGTDTLEDTAYYLHCVVDTSRVAVVVTGSQRTPHAMGSDAYANLRQALELAACDQAKGLGVLVSFNQSVFSAGVVRKTSTYQLHGFEAPGWGPVGLLDEGHFHLMQRPVLQPLLPNPESLPRVDIVPVYGGADVAMVEAVLGSGPAGIVIDGIGRGQVPPGWVQPLHQAIQQGQVVSVCSSALHGAVRQSYEYPGALLDLVNAGALEAPHLCARKARIRLALAMATGSQDRDSLARAFSWTAPAAESAKS